LRGGEVKSLIVCTALAILAVAMVAPIEAFDGGVADTDMPTSSGGCSNAIGCHGTRSTNGVLTLEAIASDGDWNTPGEAGSLKVVVNIDSASSDAHIAGVMLLDPDIGGNIKSNGWSITADPNQNDTAFNYNRMISIAGDTTFVWEVTSPESTGTYRILARMHFDDNGSVYNLSDTLQVSFPVGSPDQGYLIDPEDSPTLMSHPNPFAERTIIYYHQPEDGYAILRVYDSSGRLVRTLVQGEHLEGAHSATWDGTNSLGQEIPGGLYFYRLETADLVTAGKTVVLR
jgi:hypothetical protein